MVRKGRRGGGRAREWKRDGRMEKEKKIDSHSFKMDSYTILIKHVNL